MAPVDLGLGTQMTVILHHRDVPGCTSCRNRTQKAQLTEDRKFSRHGRLGVLRQLKSDFAKFLIWQGAELSKFIIS